VRGGCGKMKIVGGRRPPGVLSEKIVR